MTRLAQLEWRLAAPPWTAVFSPDGGKMIPGKENANLLGELLHAHLAPRSAQAIKRARRTYKELRGQQYPLSDDDLAQRVPAVEAPAAPEPTVQRPELSEMVESELAEIPAEELE